MVVPDGDSLCMHTYTDIPYDNILDRPRRHLLELHKRYALLVEWESFSLLTCSVITETAVLRLQLCNADPLIAVLDDPALDLADREHYQKDWLGALSSLPSLRFLQRTSSRNVSQCPGIAWEPGRIFAGER